MAGSSPATSRSTASGRARAGCPWLSHYADDRVQRFSENMRRNIFALVALCRFVPGVVFVAFIACGWSRVSLTRFTLASLVVSAIYLPLTLYLVIQFGTALDEVIGWWTWPLLLAGMATFGLMRKRVFAFGDASGQAGPALSLPRTMSVTSLLSSWRHSRFVRTCGAQSQELLAKCEVRNTKV
jgi:hypothetical protein